MSAPRSRGRARNHPQQVERRGAPDRVDDKATDPEDRGGEISTEFLPGRPRFRPGYLMNEQLAFMPGADPQPGWKRPPFGCVLVIWDRSGPLYKPSSAQVGNGK